MKKNIVISLGGILLLSACVTSITLPVQGGFNKGKEKFIGEATGKIDGSGTITMTTESGTSCSGTFQYAQSMVTGTGIFHCDDGRTGKFTFTTSGNTGIGFGKTNKGEPFKFAFGHNQIVTTW